MKQRPYTVPDNYFERLETNLSNIPSRMVKRNHSAFIPAIAACCLAAVVAVGLISKDRSQIKTEEISYEQLFIADMIPHTDPYSIYQETFQAESASSEEVAEYLIDSNTSLYTIAEYLNR